MLIHCANAEGLQCDNEECLFRYTLETTHDSVLRNLPNDCFPMECQCGRFERTVEIAKWEG